MLVVPGVVYLSVRFVSLRPAERGRSVVLFTGSGLRLVPEGLKSDRED